MSSVPATQLDEIVEQEIGRGFEFSLKPVFPIELVFKGVDVWTEFAVGGPCKKVLKHKLILNNLSGKFQAGSATAIIGSSGSGKTTLLNYLSSRMQDSKLKAHGELFVNGNQVLSIKSIKHRTGFVNQFDILFTDLTPREQLVYTAKLSGLSDPEAKSLEILGVLGLDKCADTRVGDEVKRGVSGGERKRVAIGVELITDPSLLFLDEPTTGLDSKSALDVASILRKLADNGRTVITTIHCPSSEILAKFDRLICMCRGEIIFDGTPDHIIPHFAKIGYPVPPLTNPADHLMEIINEDDIRIAAMNRGEEISEDTVKTRFQERIELFVRSSKIITPDPVHEADKPAPYSEAVSKAHITSHPVANFGHVMHRCLKIYFRNPQSFRTKIVQTLGFAAFAIILQNNTTDPKVNTQQSILDKGGMAFNVTSTMCFAGIFANLYTFIPALPTFRRESQNKLYGPLTFFFTHAFFELPFVIFQTVLYLLCVFWVINIRRDSFETFVKYFVVLFCSRFGAGGLGDLLSVSIKDIAVINQAFPVIVVPLFLVSGFVALIKDIRWHMIIYSYFSFFRFGFEGAVNIEYDEATRQALMSSCRVFLSKCGDKSSPACYYNPKPQELGQYPQCDPRLVFDFFHGTHWYVPCFWLIAQGVLFRFFAVLATYSFAKDAEVHDDKVPADLQVLIDKRNQIKFEELQKREEEAFYEGKKNAVSPSKIYSTNVESPDQPIPTEQAHLLNTGDARI